MDRRRFLSFSLLTAPALTILDGCKILSQEDTEGSELEAAASSRAPNGLVHNLRYDSVPIVKSSLKLKTGFTSDSKAIRAQALRVLNSPNYGRFTLRCGGHSYIGASVAPNGYVIDLSPFNRISIDSSKSTIRIGGGCKLFEVSQALAKLPKPSFIPSGDCPTVGIGGFITGGGASRLSNTLGFAVDKVVRFTAILFRRTGKTFTSEIVNASPLSNPELYWAMLGGGAQFAIISDITLRYQVLENYSLFSINARQADEGQFTRFFRDWEKLNGILAKTSSLSLQVDNHQSLLCLGTFADDTGDAERLRNFANSHSGSIQIKPLTMDNIYTTFSGCDSLDTCKVKSWTLNPLYFAAKSFIGESFGEISDGNLIAMRNMLERNKSDYAYFQFTRWSGAMNRKNPRVSFPFRNAAFECQVNVSSNRRETWQDDYLKWVDEGISLLGTRKAAFLNHLNHDILIDKKVYLGESLARLDAAKKVYDPANVFNPFHVGDNRKF